MPRTEEANQRLREAQREKILAGAREVFARKGKAATIADIAAAAQVSQGLAYRYFANKEAIFQALVDQFAETSTDALERIMTIPGTPWRRLEILITKLLEVRRDQFQLNDRVLDDETVTAEQLEILRGQVRRLQTVLRQLIVAGQAAGEVAGDDPDQLVTAIMACLNGLNKMSRRDPEQFQMPDAGILLRMLRK